MSGGGGAAKGVISRGKYTKTKNELFSFMSAQLFILIDGKKHPPSTKQLIDLIFKFRIQITPGSRFILLLPKQTKTVIHSPFSNSTLKL